MRKIIFILLFFLSICVSAPSLASSFAGAAVRKNGLWSFIDGVGREIIPYCYQEAFPFNPETGLALVKSNNKWGLIDASGVMVFVSACDSLVMTFDSDKYIVGYSSADSLYYFYEDMQLQSSSYYDYLEYCYGAGFVVGNNIDNNVYGMLRLGYLNLSGKVLGQGLKYDECYCFENDKAMVLLDGLYGYVNREGYEIIPPKFLVVRNFSEGFAAVSNDDSKFFIINESGERVFDFTFDSSPDPFFEGLIYGSVDGLYCYYNTKGELEIQLPERMIGCRFNQGLAQFYYYGRDYHIGLIDRKGEIVVPAKYRDIGVFAYPIITLSPLTLGHDMRYLYNVEKKEIVSSKYDYISGLYGGAYLVSLYDEEKGIDNSGFIDSLGNEIIKPLYQSWSYFSEGLVVMAKKGKLICMNIKGEEVFVFPPKTEHTSAFCNGISAFGFGGKVGFITATGKVLVEPQFDAYRIFGNKYSSL